MRLENRIFLRSFCWQCSWSFTRMQCLGLAYAIYPLLKKLYGHDQAQLTRRTRCYLNCFNSNPYLAAGILGFLVHMESQGEEMGDQGLSLSSGLSALYGAVGDNFFWNGLKPMTSALAVMIFFWRPGLAAPVFLLLFYNLVHISIRYVVYLCGVHRGIGVLEKIDSWRLPLLRNIMEYITTASLAVTVYLMVDYFNLQRGFGADLFYLFMLLLVAGLWWYRKTGSKGFCLKNRSALLEKS